MARRDPMVVEVKPTPLGFDVIVEHNVAQSWSRAVDPRATRAAHEYLRRNRHLISAKRMNPVYGEHDRPAGKDGIDRCTSRYIFHTPPYASRT